MRLPASYRSEIDGLRAIAVTAVVLFHAFPWRITGGFIGVDVFFVISGYLITQILYRDIVGGTYTLFEFYGRRVRRLFPAFAAVLATSLMLGSLLLLPVDARAFNVASLATLVFTSNIFFWTQIGYFAPNAEALPLLHTWSLAVEEQFYIVFPMFLYALHRWAQRHLHVAVLAIALLSFAICIWGTFYKPGATFFLAPFRAWELLVGALIALRGQYVRLCRPALETLPIAGLGLIAAGVIFVDNTTPFPGIGALPAVAGAAAVIVASVASTATLVTRLLSWRPLRALGLLSYPLYLWHWPALVLARDVVGGPLEPLHAVSVLIICVMLSAATYRLIEAPVRRRRFLSSTASLFVAAATATAVMATFNTVLIIRDGYLLPAKPEVRAQIFANQRVVDEKMDPCTSLNYKRPLANAADVTYCPIASNSQSHEQKRKVLFWGDSFMEHLLPAVSDANELGAFSDRQIVFAVSHGCQPTPGIERRERGYYCNQFNRYVQSRASLSDIDAVIMGGAWTFDPDYLGLVGNGASTAVDANTLTAQAESELVSIITPLTTAGKRVALILSFPAYSIDIPRYLARRLLAGQAAEVLLTRAAMVIKSSVINEMLKRVAARTGATTWDPVEALCPEGPCIYQDHMLTYYKDRSHLTKEGSRLLLLPMIQAMAERLQ